MVDIPRHCKERDRSISTSVGCGISTTMQGVYSTAGNTTVKVGPVIERNSFGLVLVEILEDVKMR